MYAASGFADGTGGQIVSIQSHENVQVRPDDGSSVCEMPMTHFRILPEIPLEGVSLAFLRAFHEEFQDQIAGMTTADVCSSLVKPLCQGPHSSLAAALQRVAACDAKLGQPFVAPATIFVSHAWKFTFAQLLDALEGHVPAQDAYLWLDIFVVNQHDALEKPKIWWTVAFRDAIRHIGSVVLVLAPWTDPIPLTRAWCLWEIVSAVKESRPLRIALSSSEERSLRAAIVNDFPSVQRALSTVDVRRAEAYFASDRAMILQAAEEEVGLSMINQVVIQQMRDWLVHVARDAVSKLADEDLGGSSLAFGLSQLLQHMGRLEDAEGLLDQTLEARRTLYGENDVRTIDAMNELSIVLQNLGRSHDAERLMRSALEAGSMTLGPSHSYTLTIASNLATVLADRGKLEDAASLARRIHGERLILLGVADPETLVAANNLAFVLMMQGFVDDAEQLALPAFRANCECAQLGPRHPQTLDAAETVIQIWACNPQKLDAAEALAAETHLLCLETLGEAHFRTRMSCESLQRLRNMQIARANLDSHGPTSSTSCLPLFLFRWWRQCMCV
jgi:tetratricopeptide (TPR) repeat protein